MTERPAAGPLVELEQVGRRFRVRDAGGGLVDLWAVRDVTLNIARGETLGLVGESGCGKSTLGRVALRLLEPTEGEVRFEGSRIDALSPRALRTTRRRMQLVFQDPAGSLNPRLRAGAMLLEPLRVHRLARGAEADARVRRLVERVGLSADVLERFPHELSGGQRQRLGIARALSVEPSFLVADEPVSALDVSVQAQVVNLLMDLKESLGLTYLFISHDLQLVRHVSDRVAVMYCGHLVELGQAASIYERPAHPYARALLAATPGAPPGGEDEHRLRGEPPSPLQLARGCAFHPRCPEAEARCCAERPAMRDAGDRRVACHRC